MEDAVEVVAEKEIAETQQEEEEEEEEEPQLPMAPPPKPKKAGRPKKEVVKPVVEIAESQYTPGKFKEDSPKDGKNKAASKEEAVDTRDINQLRKENEELKEHIAKLIAVEETEPERLLKEFRVTAVEAEDSKTLPSSP